MITSNTIGTFLQGQIISIVITTPDDATAEEIAVLKDNDLYIGIYNASPVRSKIKSTVDGTVSKAIDGDSVTLSAMLSAEETKIMAGHYTIELLIKNADNTFTSPCKNIVSFDVERRKIAEVIR